MSNAEVLRRPISPVAGKSAVEENLTSELLAGRHEHGRA